MGAGGDVAVDQFAQLGRATESDRVGKASRCAVGGVDRPAGCATRYIICPFNRLTNVDNSVVEPVQTAGVQPRNGIVIRVRIQVSPDVGGITSSPDSQERMVLPMVRVVEAGFVVVAVAGE